MYLRDERAALQRSNRSILQIGRPHIHTGLRSRRSVQEIGVSAEIQFIFWYSADGQTGYYKSKLVVYTLDTAVMSSP